MTLWNPYSLRANLRANTNAGLTVIRTMNAGSPEQSGRRRKRSVSGHFGQKQFQQVFGDNAIFTFQLVQVLYLCSVSMLLPFARPPHTGLW